MKGKDILTYMGLLKDEYILEAAVVPKRKKAARYASFKRFAAAACICLAVTAVFAGIRHLALSGGDYSDMASDGAAPESTLKEYSDKVNALGYGIFGRLKTEDDNTFISPMSIYITMAMLVNGADGVSRDELMDTLGITDYDECSSVLAEYIRQSSRADCFIADSVWLGDNMAEAGNIEKDFISPLKKYYNSTVYENVLFNDSTAKKMNEWVYENTGGMIEKITDGFLPDTMFALINAIYFEGEWSNAFDKGNTVKEEFFGSSGTKFVDMMTSSEANDYRYFKDDSFAGIELEYKDTDYAMDIIMSADNGKRTGDVWDMLSDEGRSRVTDRFAEAEYESIRTLKIPRLELEYRTEDGLIEALSDMGLRTIFDKASSDLSKIGKDLNGDNLYVNKLIHKTALKADEKGTKAAAVTYAGEDAAAPAVDETAKDFIVDRPFIFIIRDTISQTVLFIGEVNNL